MYKLPKNFDGNFLIGCVLEQICFNQNQLCLHFNNNVSITIEGSFSYGQEDSEANHKIINIPIKESDIMQLLGIPVSKAYGDKNGTLYLIFNNGYSLRCYDSSSQYESYQIKYGDTLIIV
ncbi:MAG: DUF6188 family protein [Planctomycetota bacterium]